MPRSYADPRELIADPDVDAIVIVSPTHTHKDLVIAAAAARQADVLREAAGAVADECRAMQQRRRAARHVLSDGLHAPVRSRLRGGEAADRRRAASAGRSCSSPPRAIRSARASSTRTRPAAAASSSTWASTTSIWRAGSWATSQRCRRSAACSRFPELATVGDLDNAIATLDLRRRPARRDRSDAQRLLRLRHLDRTARHRGHACASATCARRRC